MLRRNAVTPKRRYDDMDYRFRWDERFIGNAISSGSLRKDAVSALQALRSGLKAPGRRRTSKAAIGAGGSKSLWQCRGPQSPQAFDPRNFPAQQNRTAAGSGHGIFRAVNIGETPLSNHRTPCIKAMDTRKVTIVIPRLLIRLYQVLRSGSAPRCRFYPTCSDYMLEALDAKGLLAGAGAGILRILKCHPWHPGGYDPIQPIMSDYDTHGSQLTACRDDAY